MYKLNRYEFMQYEIAESRLLDLQAEHAEELQHAYDSIHPTRTQVDYHLGQAYAESINPAEYAIYLVDMQEKHEQIERYWEMRAATFKKALKRLNEHELSDYKQGSFLTNQKVRNKLSEHLSQIVEKVPELQREEVTELDHVEEYDNMIEDMTEDELLEDYWSLDEHLEQMNERCLYLRDAQNLTIKDISYYLGLTSSRVKEILQEAT